MYPVERSEMSAARQQMMARRRRSLSILGGGSVLDLAARLVVGGGLFWAADRAVPARPRRLPLVPAQPGAARP